MKRLQRKIMVAVLTLALVAGGIFTFTRTAQAIGLGDVLKVGGIILVVSTFDDQINNFINDALNQKDAASVGATKVVPIFSVGRGAYVGAAQVVGLPASVSKVQGVAALDVAIGQLEGTGLVPITTQRPGRTIDRVGGVGIGAIIDFRI